MKHGYCLPGNTIPEKFSGETATKLESVLWELTLLKKAGYHFGEISVGMLLSFQDEELDILKNAPLPIEVCNCFIPGEYCVPDASQAESLRVFVEKVLTQASRLGVPVIVFGSGGARRVPETMSMEDGRNQIKSFLSDCNTIAAKFGITIVVEPLNHKESNIFLSVREGAETVRALNLPQIKLLADSYHMSIENEPFEAITENLEILQHIHIAEPISRNHPGMDNDASLPALGKLLKEIGYTHRVTVECKAENWAEDIVKAKEVLDRAF